MRGIYYFKNLITGHKYIGSSEDLHKRYKNHVRLMRNNKHFNIHLQYAWNKYGEDNFVYVQKEFPKGSLLLREEKYIKLCGHYNLCKLPTKGTKGLKKSEDSKAKLSNIVKEWWKQNPYTYGKEVSNYDFMGNYISTFPSMSVAGIPVNIKRAIERKSLANGFQWRYGNDKTNIGINKNTIFQLDKEGNIINTFPSSIHAAESSGYHPNAIIRSCSNQLEGRWYSWRKGLTVEKTKEYAY